MSDFKRDADALLQGVVEGSPQVPGVVAMVTGKKANTYEGAAGERVIGAGEPMTTDTVFAIYSATKAITGTAVLQCVEEGLIDLDLPAKAYQPALGRLQVITGFDEKGNPKLRPPKRDITTRMLMLHTAGFGYDFFNPVYSRLAREKGQPSTVTATQAALTTPLLFDPGERWEYGSGVDWCGLIVERVRDQRLGAVMKERIFRPLGMEDTAFRLTPAMRCRLARVHKRRPDGSLNPLRDYELKQDAEIDMGGHGLYASIGDYMKFIRMWLNDGAGPNGSVLKAETVGWAVRSGLERGQKVTALPGVIPSLSNDVEFFPGVKKSWSYTFMVNDEDAPTGRPAGSLGWAGLANLYYWIDRVNGIGGFWASQILPFADKAALRNFTDFESAVYRHAIARDAA
ncbi:MAG: class A beta-lactamase-related serine hydrolase [Rhizobiaceae bacterium]|nr:MAG: class A beta-lactamase-related serine hydrolase [Rhizobiaceae bacterium]